MIPAGYFKELFTSSRKALQTVQFKYCENVDLANIVLFLITRGCCNVRKLVLIPAKRTPFSKLNILTDYTMLANVLTKLEILKIQDESSLSITSLLNRNPEIKNLNLYKMHKINVGPLKASLEKLVKLRKLNLKMCYQLTDLDSVLARHKSLLSLKLENIQLQSSSLNCVLNLNNLRKLNLCGNRNVSESFIIALSQSLSKLETLSLNACPITNLALEALSSSPLSGSLRKLELGATEITHLGLRFIQQFRYLSFLNISGNSIQNMVTNITFILSRLVNLDTICLAGYEQLVVDTAKTYRIKVKTTPI